MPLLLLPLSFLAGLTAIDGLLYVLLALAILFEWVRRDAKRRKIAFSWPLRIALIALTIVALPYYFFQSRGWLGGLKLAALSWVIFVGSMLCYRIGYSI